MVQVLRRFFAAYSSSGNVSYTFNGWSISAVSAEGGAGGKGWLRAQDQQGVRET